MDKELLSNGVFNDQPLCFSVLPREKIDDVTVETGAIVQPNGDILFRIFAPRTNEVLVTSHLHIGGGGTRNLTLEKDDEGFFTGLLPYLEDCTGPAITNVYFDGTLLLYPYIPIYWEINRPCNYVEIPDPELDFMFIKDLPHGSITRDIYWTDVLNKWQRCKVYTPPGYMKSTEEYPVLYLLNGGGENEHAWEFSGRVPYILDNLIAAGEISPFIVVMNNGMVRFREYEGNVVDDAFERILIESSIPYIEKNYRVKTGKWNRAIAGLSMGSFMTNDIGFKHPDLFAHMGQFTACMTELNLKMTYERPFPAAVKDPARFAENYKVFFRSTTPLEDHFEYFEADDRICSEVGIDKLSCYHRIVYSKETSKWNSWRMGLRDFARLIFR